MPRRLKDSDCRRHQIGVFVRSQDLRLWRSQAKERGCSLSSFVYQRCLMANPLPSRDTTALIGAIGRVGSILNQLTKIAWSEGLDATRFSDAHALAKEVQRLLQSAAFYGGKP